MDKQLALGIVLCAAAVVVILGVIVVLAALIAYIVKVCVAKSRAQDMPLIMERITGLIGMVEKFTPRYQGVGDLARPLRGIAVGINDTGAAPTVPAQQMVIIPGQAEASAVDPAGIGSQR